VSTLARRRSVVLVSSKNFLSMRAKLAEFGRDMVCSAGGCSARSATADGMRGLNALALLRRRCVRAVVDWRRRGAFRWPYKL